MSWASSLTDQPCVAWLAPSSLNSTTNGPSAVDTSHPPFSPSMKLLQGPNPQKRLRLRQHQQDDALLHHLTGRDLRQHGRHPLGSMGVKWEQSNIEILKRRMNRLATYPQCRRRLWWR